MRAIQLRRIHSSPLMWSFSRAVKYPQDFDPVQSRSYTIRNYVAGIGHNELASTVNAPRVAESWIICQKSHGVVDSLHHKPCGLGIVFGNVVGFLVEVLQCCGQPLNLHPLPTLRRFA